MMGGTISVDGSGIMPANLVKDTVRIHESGRDFRIHWMALGAAGLRVGDRLHVAPTLPIVLDVAMALGAEKATTIAGATIIVSHKPTENQLISLINRLKPDVRLLVYNDECDIEGMFERSFDLATACIFDQESRKVVRIYDKECKVKAYIEVELTELSDSSISMQATRIATLR
jgi:hypothetical protein